MKKAMNVDGRSVNRRSFLKTGVLAGGAATLTAGLAASGVPAFADDHDRDDRLTKGDVAILRFLATAELLESDLWVQYAELGGVTDGTQNNYQLAFQFLDGDGSQYITSNTLDEISHATRASTSRSSNKVDRFFMQRLAKRSAV